MPVRSFAAIAVACGEAEDGGGNGGSFVVELATGAFIIITFLYALLFSNVSFTNES